MKKALMLISIMFFALAANAEALYAGDALYYHAIPDCMGHEYAEVANTDGLYPCPVCVPDPVDYGGLRYFNIGGLTVIRMSDAFIQSREDVGSVFGFTDTVEYTGAEAEAELAETLHGEDYIRFRAEIRESGEASAPAPHASSLLSDGDHLYPPFHIRHLGGAWVEVLAPFDAMEDGEINPRFFTGELEWKDGTLTVDCPDEWDAYESSPEITDLSALEPVWTASEDSWRLQLYEAEDMRILTLRITGGDALLAPDASVHCIGWPEALDMTSPWRDGGDCLYGVALTQGEAEALKAGAPEVSYHRFADLDPDYQDSPYAIAATEDGKSFVLDADRNVVIPPEYGMMSRLGNVFLCGNWNHKYTENWTLIDADHGAMLMEADNLILGLKACAECIALDDYSEIRIVKDGEAVAELPGREDYETVTVTLYGDPAVYTLNYSDEICRWIDMEDPRRSVPEDVLVLIVHTDNNRPASDGPDCAVIIWSLTGDTPPTPEAIGLVDTVT